MIIINKYICEFCNTEYDSEKDALECEAQGFPEPMPFLQLGAKLPAFGENGIRYGTINNVYISNWYGMPKAPHEWVVNSDLHASSLSHNADYDSLLPATAFDPRHGWDPFRYGCTPEEAKVWTETMNKYGFPITNDSIHYSALRKYLNVNNANAL